LDHIVGLYSYKYRGIEYIWCTLRQTKADVRVIPDREMGFIDIVKVVDFDVRGTRKWPL
jgi:hypothetical protein